MNANDMMVQAMAVYLDEHLSDESALRELLDRVGYNDPDLSVVDCLASLVNALTEGKVG